MTPDQTISSSQINDDDRWRGQVPFYINSLQDGSADVSHWVVSGEKGAYHERVKDWVRKLPFFEGSCVIVAGVGLGGEPNKISEVLEERYPGSGGPSIVSADYMMDIVDNLGKWTSHSRVQQGLTPLDITELDTEVKPESAMLITMSSVMHELKSVGGWEGMLKGFLQATKALAPGGVLLVRDFYPPEYQPCQILLSTDLARSFFDLFIEDYHPQVMPGFMGKEEWSREGDLIKANTLFAFETKSHLRMLLNDRYKRWGEKAFRPSFWHQWTQLTESYVITRRKYPSVPQVLDALKTEAASYGLLTYELEIVDDSEDDDVIQSHLALMPNIPSQRFLATFKKGEGSQK